MAESTPGLDPEQVTNSGDRRSPIVFGQWAVGARRAGQRVCFSDIVGPHVTTDLVEARQEQLDTIPKPIPQH